MGFTAATPTRVFVGAGELFLDAIPIGMTQEENMFRITREYVDIPKPNGMKGRPAQLDYVSTEVPQIEVTLSELVFDQLSLALPGLASVASAAVGGGVSTDLDEPTGTAIGDTTIAVTAAGAAAAGMFLKIGTGVGAEHVLVRSVASNVITLSQPLTKVHADTDAVVQQTGRGGSILTSTPGRIATADYIGVVELLVPGVDDNLVSFRVYDAISVDNFEIEVSDETNARYQLTFEGRYDPANPLVAPYAIETLTD